MAPPAVMLDLSSIPSEYCPDDESLHSDVSIRAWNHVIDNNQMRMHMHTIYNGPPKMIVSDEPEVPALV